MRENKENIHIHGQMNFDSGWEWGYWLNDVVTARASWDPQVDSGNEWDAYAVLLKPMTRIFGSDIGTALEGLLIELTKLQVEMLIYGRIDGKDSLNIDLLSGIAYVSGADTWLDIPRMFGLKFTQPDKIHMNENDHILYPEVIRLLTEMEVRFQSMNEKFKSLLGETMEIYNNGKARMDTCTSKVSNDSNEVCDMQSNEMLLINEHSLNIMYEFSDALAVLTLRISHVLRMYLSNSHHALGNATYTAHMLSSGREILQTAAQIVARREAHYRVPWRRIASWRENPTVYRFGYLWAVCLILVSIVLITRTYTYSKIGS
jgi:hypothetical protein